MPPKVENGWFRVQLLTLYKTDLLLHALFVEVCSPEKWDTVKLTFLKLLNYDIARFKTFILS